jgi:hypothetical protein
MWKKLDRKSQREEKIAQAFHFISEIENDNQIDLQMTLIKARQLFNVLKLLKLMQKILTKKPNKA